MRLINTKTGEFVEFFDVETIPPYAILSHTWDKILGEQTYQDVVRIQEKCRHDSSPLTGNSLSSIPTNEPATAADKPGIPTDEPTLQEDESGSRSGSLGSREGNADSQKDEIRRSIFDPDSGLSEKVRRACEVARCDGYLYMWVDSCCIDKTSSAELSEAINSMYNWYLCAQVCYAYLADVPYGEDVREEDSQFRNSRWHTRCWTLQELIAPRVLVFFSKDWKGLGTKDALADVVKEITSIDQEILTHKKAISEESVAERMRWAATRTSTRVEDEAYSLLGIFGITMPTLYGEGRYAFRRLQEEILQRIPDQSLFAWGEVCLSIPSEPGSKFRVYVSTNESITPFALSPESFNSSRDRTVPVTDHAATLLPPIKEYVNTPFGIRTELSFLPLQALRSGITLDLHAQKANVTWYIVLLRCQHANNSGPLLGLKLCYVRRDDEFGVEFLYLPENITVEPEGLLGEASGCNSILFTLSSDDFMEPGTEIQTKTVYLPHPKPFIATRAFNVKHNPHGLNLQIPMWVRDALGMQNYTISDIHGPTEHQPNSSSLTLFHRDSSFSIHVEYRNMRINGFMVIDARIWILSCVSEVALHDTAHWQALRRSTPLYTSAIWIDQKPWDATLPSRTIYLVTDSRERVELRLGLDLSSQFPSRYNVRIEVIRSTDSAGEVGAPLLRPDRDSDSETLEFPMMVHEAFNLILPGSVRIALKLNGYSVDLELGPNQGGFPSHCLTLSSGSGSSSSFVIGIKFFHLLGHDIPTVPEVVPQHLKVAARVTLESSGSVPDDGSDLFQDGPYVVNWYTCYSGSTERSLGENQIVLATPSGGLLTLRLNLELAWESEYYLYIDVVEVQAASLSPSQAPVLQCNRHPDVVHSLEGVHAGIGLTLPGHIRRELKAQGYQVHFEGLDGGNEATPGDPIRHRLTLSHIRADVVIVVEYSHHFITNTHEENSHSTSADAESDSDIDPQWTELSTALLPRLLGSDYLPRTPGVALEDLLGAALEGLGRHHWQERRKQELTLQASVKVVSSGGSQPEGNIRGADQGDDSASTATWDGKYPTVEIGTWMRQLPRQDIILTLPTGNQLRLRLGFDLVWFSEYCLMVEINPRTPIPQSDFQPKLDMQPVYDYELDEAGIEYIRQSRWRLWRKRFGFRFGFGFRG